MDYIRLNLHIAWEMILDLKGLLSPHRLVLLKVLHEGEDIKTFIFKPTKPFHYQAGQYGVWFPKRWIWGKPWHLFTIASSPTEETLQLSTRISKSDFKQKLNRLKPGDSVVVFAPIGQFTVPTPAPSHITMIAGGIGITPVRSIVRYIYDTKTPTTTSVIHSGDGYYIFKEQLEAQATDYHCVDRSNFMSTLEMVAKKAEPGAIFYVSGPPGFVNLTKKTLADLGIKKIKQDGFLGY